MEVVNEAVTSAADSRVPEQIKALSGCLGLHVALSGWDLMFGHLMAYKESMKDVGRRRSGSVSMGMGVWECPFRSSPEGACQPACASQCHSPWRAGRRPLLAAGLVSCPGNLWGQSKADGWLSSFWSGARILNFTAVSWHRAMRYSSWPRVWNTQRPKEGASYAAWP